MAFIQKFRVLTSIDEFDANNIVFDKPVDEEVGGNKHIKGKRIKIGIMKDGKTSELIIPTEKLYAYKGVLPTKPFGREDTDEIIGYNIPIALYSRDDSLGGRDRKFVEIFRQIIDTTKDHVVSVKKNIGQPHLVKELLYKWDNILYEKKDESGEPLNEFGPTLYAKLMYSKDKNLIATKLVDFNRKVLSIDDVMGKPCNIITCVKFDSIYINSNGCSLQVKLTEAILDVKATDDRQSLLLESFLNTSGCDVDEVVKVPNMPSVVEEESDDSGNDTEPLVLSDSDGGGADGGVVDDEEEEDARVDNLVVEDEEEAQPKKKATKRIVKKWNFKCKSV